MERTPEHDASLRERVYLSIGLVIGFALLAVHLGVT